jgi:hypothetical protein
VIGRHGCWRNGTLTVVMREISLLTRVGDGLLNGFTQLGYPVVRRLQKRFGRDSAASMLRAVHCGDEAKTA